MADIFLSYASEDRDRIRPLLTWLSGHHREWIVWWKDLTPRGQSWVEVVKELKLAKCLIVVWTATSINNEYVKTEVAEATKWRNVYNFIPILLDDVQHSLPFKLTQTVSLVGWDGISPHPALNEIAWRVEAILSKSQLEQESYREHLEREQRRADEERQHAEQEREEEINRLIEKAKQALESGDCSMALAFIRTCEMLSETKEEKRLQEELLRRLECEIQQSKSKLEKPEPKSKPKSEPVLLGASAPKAVKPGDEFTARFVAYEKRSEEEVRGLLEKLSPEVEPVLGVHECQWQYGTRVTIRLSGRGLVIDPPEQEFSWAGGRTLLDFDVNVPNQAPEGTVVLKFDAAIEGIVVARLRLDLEIAVQAVSEGNATARAEPAQSAFASYSSKDRLRVLDRVAAVKISAGIEVFLDCLDLHPGEEWKPRIDNEIRQRDLFLLFWSKNASESKWVMWELDTALKEKGEHALQLHPLDPDIKPPAGLEELHISDVTMWVRKAYERIMSGDRCASDCQ